MLKIPYFLNRVCVNGEKAEGSKFVSPGRVILTELPFLAIHSGEKIFFLETFSFCKLKYSK